MSALDELVKAVGPAGDLCKKPCPDERWHDGTVNLSHYLCKGTGKVFDTEHPLSKALYRRIGNTVASHPSDAGTYYVPRSWTEACSRLLSAIPALGWTGSLIRAKRGWGCVLYAYDRDGRAFCESGAETWEETLAAAVLAAMRARKEAANA